MKSDWKSLAQSYRSCCQGEYFSEGNEIGPARVGALLNRVFFFMILVQLRTKSPRPLAAIAGFLLFFFYSSDISPACFISERVFFPHPFSIVIGSKAYIDGRVIVFDGVSLGKKYPGTRDGMPKIVGDGILGGGSKLLGEITLTKNFVVGANSVLLNSLSNQTYSGGQVRDGVYFKETV